MPNYSITAATFFHQSVRLLSRTNLFVRIEATGIDKLINIKSEATFRFANPVSSIPASTREARRAASSIKNPGSRIPNFHSICISASANK